MIFEIGSSIVMGGVVGYTYLLKSGGIDDASKIQRICANSGLTVKENGQTKTIHLHRKSRNKWGNEYVYRIPLGLSFKDFDSKKHVLQDGLNNKRTVLDLSVSDLRPLNFKQNIIRQVKALIEKKKAIRKEVELSYDGMLHVRVYNEPLTEYLPYSDCPKMKGWNVFVGESRGGSVLHDFEKIPHIIVAGTTRYGKSVFLKNVITTLIHRQSESTRFTLIDLKGGLTFNRYKNASQVVRMASNVEETLEALRQVHNDMKAQMERFNENGWENITDTKIRDRHFVVIDEAAQISSQGETDPVIKKKKIEIEGILAEIARIGGGIGFRLIYATQYPTNETIRPQIRQNCDARLCFKLQTGIASRAVLDEEGAEELPLIKGRGIYLTDRKRLVQTPFIDNETVDDLIKPYIVMKARKDDGVENRVTEGTKRGTDSLIVEETGLS